MAKKRVLLLSSGTFAVFSGILTGMSILGLLAVISGLVDLTGTGESTSKLLIFGTLITLFSSYLYVYPAEIKLSRSESLLGVSCAFLSCIFASSFLYMLTTGSGFNDSLFESTAAFSTTSLSVLDIDSFGNGVLFFRTFSQLVGSFSAILVAVMFLPISEYRDQPSSSDLKIDRLFRQGRLEALKSIGLVYLASIGAMTLLLSFGKLNFFDSLLMSVSAISTGGFTTNTALLSDDYVQWVLVMGMVAAGVSFLIVWRMVKGRFTSALHSSEFQTYATLIIVSSILFYLWTNAEPESSIRQSLLFVSSAISTTGFHFSPFGNWSVAVSFLLLLLITIGPMSLSSGGGFQIIRLRILLSVSIRELVRQLHPKAVVKIRVGKEIFDDKNVRQVVVFQFLFLSVAFSTSLVLAILGMSVYDAFVSSLNALTTAGPIRGIDGSIIDTTKLSSGERLTLLPAMISGRLYLLPIFIALGYFLSESRNLMRPRRRFLRWKNSFKS